MPNSLSSCTVGVRPADLSLKSLDEKLKVLDEFRQVILHNRVYLVQVHSTVVMGEKCRMPTISGQ